MLNWASCRRGKWLMKVMGEMTVPKVIHGEMMGKWLMKYLFSKIAAWTGLSLPWPETLTDEERASLTSSWSPPEVCLLSPNHEVVKTLICKTSICVFTPIKLKNIGLPC